MLRQQHYIQIPVYWCHDRNLVGAAAGLLRTSTNNACDGSAAVCVRVKGGGGSHASGIIGRVAPAGGRKLPQTLSQNTPGPRAAQTTFLKIRS